MTSTASDQSSDKAIRKSKPGKLPVSGVAVGVAVIIKPVTFGHGSDVGVLLQKRGKKVPHPREWSLPGGLMDETNDSHDHYVTGVLREAAETASAGTPEGMPALDPLLYTMHHTGRTITHVFALRPGTDFDDWQPQATRKFRQEVDTTFPEVTINDTKYTGVNGYVWVKWTDLVTESYKGDNARNEQLHPALTYWFRKYGKLYYKRVQASFTPCQYWKEGRCVRPDCWFWHQQSVSPREKTNIENTSDNRPHDGDGSSVGASQGKGDGASGDITWQEFERTLAATNASLAATEQEIRNL